MKAKNHSKSTRRPESIAPVQPAAHKDIGFNTSIVEQAIAAGPAGLRQAQRIALRYARRYQEEAVDEWKLETEWLKSFDAVHRARARYARVWRPRFLAALSMCHSPELSARHARISCQMAYYHRKHDPQFATQWEEARDHALEMLHARVFQRCLEGDLEPIMYMGAPVAYVRKFSDKLQIEMLRAWRPERFKTPGTNVNVGTRGDVFVITEEQRHELRLINRQWLLTSPIEADDGQPHNGNLPEARSATPEPQQLSEGTASSAPRARNG